MTHKAILIEHETKRDIYEVGSHLFVQVTGEETGDITEFRVSPVRMSRDRICVPLNGVQRVMATNRKSAAENVDQADPTMSLLGH